MRTTETKHACGLRWRKCRVLSKNENFLSSAEILGHDL